MSKIKIFFSFFLISSLILLSGCGCRQTDKDQYSLELEVWGFLDDRDNLNEIFEIYKSLNPNIRDIKYRKLTTDTYKTELIDALASGQGPDIFLIHNTWLPGFSDKIIPAKAEVISEQKFKSDFVDVVSSDFFSEGQAWAVPFSVDTLALYYNKDLFNAAGITATPQNWDEFVADAMKLTKVNSFGEITQSGAAMGTAFNINRSTDILNMLIMQGGSEMVDRNSKKVTFDKLSGSGERALSPGENALSFYTQFASSSSSKYSWNPSMHYSLDAFSENNLAMMFNYSWHVETIRSKSPKLNFSVAPVPQFPNSTPVNYANYWAYAVARNKEPKISSGSTVSVTNDTRVLESWKLLKFMTTKPEGNIAITNKSVGGSQVTGGNFDPAWSYLEKSRRPAARRDLVERQKDDIDLGVFSKDNLIARSWLQPEPENIEAILAQMIDNVNRGQSRVDEAVTTAAQRIAQMMR